MCYNVHNFKLEPGEDPLIKDKTETGETKVTDVISSADICHLFIRFLGGIAFWSISLADIAATSLARRVGGGKNHVRHL